MKRLSWTILAFAVAFVILLISPAFLGQKFGPNPLLKIGDVTDILTPLILIPLYWFLYQVDWGKSPSLRENVVFLVLAAFWVEGQGMHLSANSIGQLLKGMSSSDAYDLTYFYDEVLGHYLWHVGIAGLSALLLFRQWQHPFVGQRSTLVLESVAGFIYGFIYAPVVIESQTWRLDTPFTALVVLFGLVWGRKRLRQQPLLVFFLVASLVASAFFAAWAIIWGGLPEFSEVGIID